MEGEGTPCPTGKPREMPQAKFAIKQENHLRVEGQLSPESGRGAMRMDELVGLFDS